MLIDKNGDIILFLEFKFKYLLIYDFFIVFLDEFISRNVEFFKIKLRIYKEKLIEIVERLGMFFYVVFNL